MCYNSVTFIWVTLQSQPEPAVCKQQPDVVLLCERCLLCTRAEKLGTAQQRHIF